MKFKSFKITFEKDFFNIHHNYIVYFVSKFTICGRKCVIYISRADFKPKKNIIKVQNFKFSRSNNCFDENFYVLSGNCCV